MHNSMKTLVFGQNQRNMKYAFSAASPKRKNNMHFPMEKMHISEKILEPSKMHNSMKTLVFGQNQRNMKICIFCSQPKSKKHMHFPMEKCIFLKNLGAIKNAY